MRTVSGVITMARLEALLRLHLLRRDMREVHIVLELMGDVLLKELD